MLVTRPTVEPAAASLSGGQADSRGGPNKTKHVLKPKAELRRKDTG